MTEDWKELPGFPGYALSNQGRLRSPRGLMTPGRTGATPQTVRYQVYVAGRGTQISIRLMQYMRQVWPEVEFVPTDAWIKTVRAEIKAEIDAGKRGFKPKPVLPQLQAPAKPDKPSNPGSKVTDGMPCPWAGGLFDTLPPEVATWDCAQMDPMTHRGENGIWFYVPKSAKERRKIRIEAARAQRAASRLRVRRGPRLAELRWRHERPVPALREQAHGDGDDDAQDAHGHGLAFLAHREMGRGNAELPAVPGLRARVGGED